MTAGRPNGRDYVRWCPPVSSGFRECVGLRPPRLIAGTTLHVVEVAGAAMLLSRYIAGLYVAAISMVALLAFMISGAWLLIMGASEHRDRDRKDERRTGSEG